MSLTNLSDEEWKEYSGLIKRAEKKGLGNIKFLPTDLRGWARFPKVFLEYDKEISITAS